MTRSLLPGLALSIGLAAAFHHVALGAGTSCEGLASLKLPTQPSHLPRRLRQARLPH